MVEHKEEELGDEWLDLIPDIEFELLSPTELVEEHGVPVGPQSLAASFVRLHSLQYTQFLNDFYLRQTEYVAFGNTTSSSNLVSPLLKPVEEHV